MFETIGEKKIMLDKNHNAELESSGKAKNTNGIRERLKELGATIIDFIGQKRVEIKPISEEEFDAKIAELKNPNLSLEERNRIISEIEDIITSTEELYDSIIADQDGILTEEEREELPRRKEDRISQMRKSLNDAIGLSADKKEDTTERTVKNGLAPTEYVAGHMSRLSKPEEPETNVEPATPEDVDLDAGIEITDIEPEDVTYEYNDEEPENTSSEIDMPEPQIEPQDEYVDLDAGIDVVDLDEDVDITDLTSFTDYDEYLRKYRKKEVSDEDADKFYIDLRHGNHRPGLLTEKEFVTKRTQKLDQIPLEEARQNNLELQKKIGEVQARLFTANNNAESLENQLKAKENRLKEVEEDNINLAKTRADLESKVAKKDAEIRRLEDENHAISDNLQDVTNKTYKLQNIIDELKKKADELNTRLVELQKRHEKDAEEIRVLKNEAAEEKEKYSKFVAGLNHQIDSVTENKDNKKESEVKSEKTAPKAEKSKEKKSNLATSSDSPIAIANNEEEIRQLRELKEKFDSEAHYDPVNRGRAL